MQIAACTQKQLGDLGTTFPLLKTPHHPKPDNQERERGAYAGGLGVLPAMTSEYAARLVCTLQIVDAATREIRKTLKAARVK